MRLIDADALIKNLESDAEQMEEPIAKMFTYAAINDVKHAPTVDAVPVVRCKDCKYSQITTDGKYCKYCELEKDDDGFLIEQYYESDYFCAYGERWEVGHETD